MATEFATVLDSLRANSKTDNDLGNSFEQLTKVFLENDDIQKDEFSKVWHYSDWAKTQSNYSSPPDTLLNKGTFYNTRSIFLAVVLGSVLLTILDN